jgi:hypothetical protein
MDDRYDTSGIMKHLQDVNAEINRLALERDTLARRVAELENLRTGVQVCLDMGSDTPDGDLLAAIARAREAQLAAEARVVEATTNLRTELGEYHDLITYDLGDDQ